MMKIRPQYHFRVKDDVLLAWDVERLVELSRNLPVREIAVTDIAELDENHWYEYERIKPTCKSIAEHGQLIQDADLSFPIILDADGRVMDGMHRVCKAWLNNISHIRAVQFPETPDPDFTGCDPDTLPY